MMKLWTACITPFDASGEHIDFISLKKILQIQEQAGNGILFFASTGEGISLQDKERKEVLEFVLNLGLSIPIMVGVPSYNLYNALEFLDFCKSLPISSYLLTTPIYTKPGINGQTAWFEKLLNNINVPAMLYNIPSRAGVKLYSETIKNLYGHENLWAIKDCSGGLEMPTEYKTVAPDIEIFCGDDYMLPSMVTAGASGLISVASNVWAKATRKYVEHCLNYKSLNTSVWWNSSRALFSASNPIPLKALMHHIGLILYPTVRVPLSLDDLPSLETLYNAHNEIMNWEKQYV